MPGWTPSELCQYARYHDVAIAVLGELATIGFHAKTLDHFRFSCYPGTATWRGIDNQRGYIEIHQGCDPGAIAHELGHGFHERLRHDKKLEDRFGEAYAEAIRWFVEQKAGNTEWCENFKKNPRDGEILDQSSYDWERFKKNLLDGKYYPA